VFPVFLAGWIARSLVSPPAAGTVTPVETAASLLEQSLTAAKAERFADCIESARKAANLDPGMAIAHMNIGWCASKLGQWDEGIRNTREALRLQPDMEAARNNLNWMLGEQAKASGSPPAGEMTADAALALSVHHANARRFQECIDAARQAIALRPDSADAHNNLGYCYGGLGKWDEGIASAREALRLRPDFQTAKNNLLWMVRESGRAGGRAGQQ
jgi:Flp pilus assembly protein TadD